ncbi:hypothetical protein, partial [Helicobacter rodentium]
AMTKSKPLCHCERSEAIYNQAYINFCNGILKEVQYYRLPRKFFKFSRNDKVETFKYAEYAGL